MLEIEIHPFRGKLERPFTFLAQLSNAQAQRTRTSTETLGRSVAL